MFYEVTAVMFFTNEGPARALFNHCKGLLQQAAVINPGQLNVEFSFTRLVENHHDTDPATPCIELAEANNHPPTTLSSPTILGG